MRIFHLKISCHGKYKNTKDFEHTTMPRSPLSPSKLKYSTGYAKVCHNGTYQNSFLFFEHPIKMISRDHMTMKLATNIKTYREEFFLDKKQITYHSTLSETNLVYACHLSQQ